MKKVLALLLALAPSLALAQSAGWPPPAGAIAFLGVYNSVLPTLTNGQVGFVQVDSHGQLLVSGGGGGGGAVTIADGADVAEGSTADAAATAGSTGTQSAKLRLMTTQLGTIVTNSSSAIPAGTNSIGNVTLTSQYPLGATAITASATGTTGATTATLAGTSGKTTYICWSSVRANATAAATVTDTITGVITATLSRTLWVPPNTSGLGVDEMIYNPCEPASATNTGISVVSGAPGTGGVVSVTAGGYQQ